MAKADIFMLQETKLELVDSKWVRSIWGSKSKKWSYLPSPGALEGQLILWKDLFECIETLSRAFSFSIKFQNKEDGLIWCLSSIYGLVRPYERDAFWLELLDIKALWDIPWCLGDDFNVIRFS